MTNEQANFTVGGDFFKPANGGYYGVFRGTRNGPPQTRTENGNTKTQKTVIWMFDGYNLDGTPLLDPAKGTQAIIEGMSSTSLGIGKGVPAKGRLWLQSILAAKGIAWADPQTDDQAVALVVAGLGAQVKLTVGKSQGGKDGTLKEVEAIAAAAPVAPPVTPVFVTPAAATAPGPVLQAPAAPVAPVAPPAPLAVPPAMPFTPSAPPPAAPAAPAMPFPVATA